MKFIHPVADVRRSAAQRIAISALLFLLASLIAAAQDSPAPKQDAPAPAASTTTEDKDKNQTKPADENLTGSIEVGYRFTGVNGSEETYRTFVNLGSGPRLLHLDFRYLSPTHKWFDSITGFASGWGDPYNVARLNIYKDGVYQLNFDYRNVLYYSFLPSFANPLLSVGSLLPQSAFDVNRRSFNVDLKIRPKAHISPFLAYSRDWGTGTGITDFVNGSANEYAVFTTYADRTDRYRGGVKMEFTNFHITLEEGGTTFKDDQNASTGTHNTGDLTTATNPYYLDTLNQAYRDRGSGVYTQALASWTAASWLGVNGQFIDSRPAIDSTLNEVATGNFNVPGTLQYLSRYQDFLSSNASQPHTTALVVFDLHPFKHLRILDSTMLDYFHTSGLAALADLTPQAAPGPYVNRMDYSYNRHQLEVMGDLAPWVTVRAGFRNVWGDAVVDGPQITGQPTEAGKLSQGVLLLGAQARAFSKLWANIDYEYGVASQAYFRTSLYNYAKIAGRLRYQITPKWNVALNSLRLENQNPAPSINLDFHQTQNGLSTMWSPSKTVSFVGDYYFTTLYSDITYLLPSQGLPAISDYRENAHSASAVVEINKYKGKLSFGGSLFRSSGSRPSTYYQPQARLSFPLRPKLSIFGEWRYYDYGEPFYMYEQFHSQQFTAGLRMSR